MTLQVEVTKDLRNFLDLLKEQRLLVTVDCEVDAEFEVGAICRRVLNQRGPALLFTHVKGYNMPLVAGVMDTWRRLAMSLGFSEDLVQAPEPRVTEALSRHVLNGLRSPIEPVVSTHGLCKDVINRDQEVDITKFPAPKWHPLDPGKYLGTLGCVVAKDPETGIRNVGIYRQMVVDKNRLVMKATQQIGVIIQKYKAMGKPMPVATAYGVPPSALVAACTAAPFGTDEFGLAGALQGEPLQLVKCETCDLEVPAFSEVVIEGEIPPERSMWADEGPFGEFTGFYGGEKDKRPTIYVKAVTYRRNPIMQGALEGKPPTESSTLLTIGHTAGTWKKVEEMGVPGFSRLYMPYSGCGGCFIAIASLKRHFYYGNADQLTKAIQSASAPSKSKFTIVVDDDVDVFNVNDVLWAVSTTVQPDRDVSIARNQSGMNLDPSIPPGLRNYPLTKSSRLGIDATRHYKGFEFPERCDPLPEHLDYVSQRWKTYGIDSGH